MAPPPRNPQASRSLRSVPPVPAARPAPSRAPAPARPVRPPVARGPSHLSLVWPAALVTLAVTLLRLVGELRGWNPEYFSRLPGGGLAIVGITWLVPFVGAYFGWHLARARVSIPELTGLVGWNAAAIAVGLGIGAGLEKAVQPSATNTLLLWAVVSLLVAAMSLSTWPTIGQLLLAYALAARIPGPSRHGARHPAQLGDALRRPASGLSAPGTARALPVAGAPPPSHDLGGLYVGCRDRLLGPRRLPGRSPPALNAPACGRI